MSQRLFLFKKTINQPQGAKQIHMEKDILRSMIYFGKNRSTATVRKEDIMNAARTYGYSYKYVKSCIEIMLTCNYNMDITDNKNSITGRKSAMLATPPEYVVL